MLGWVNGQWYLAVQCHLRGWQFAFARADDRLPECPIKLTCIDCQQADHYCPKEICESAGALAGAIKGHASSRLIAWALRLTSAFLFKPEPQRKFSCVE